MTRCRMNGRQAQFFEIDAIIAVVIIFVGVIYILNEPLEQPKDDDLMKTYAEDLMYIMKSTPMGSLDLSIKGQVDDFDPERSVAEQISVYWLLSEGYSQEAERWNEDIPAERVIKQKYLALETEYFDYAAVLAKDLVPQIIPPDINYAVIVAEEDIYSSTEYKEEIALVRIPQREVLSSMMAADYKGKDSDVIVQAPDAPIVFQIIVWKNDLGEVP